MGEKTKEKVWLHKWLILLDFMLFWRKYSHGLTDWRKNKTPRVKERESDIVRRRRGDRYDKIDAFLPVSLTTVFFFGFSF